MNSLLRSSRWYYQRGKEKPRRLKNEPKARKQCSSDHTPPCYVSQRRSHAASGPLPKSRAGIRRVPIAAVLREVLIAHKLRAGRSSGLAFGRTPKIPFDPWQVNGRAAKAWRAAQLAPIGMHEGRHTFASLMIGAGVNAKALSTCMGRAIVTITFDRYGHLMPGNEAEARDKIDAYLAAARG
jgi:integrase